MRPALSIVSLTAMAAMAALITTIAPTDPAYAASSRDELSTTELAESVDLGVGFVAGAVARQYLLGAEVDPHLECTSELSLSIRTGQTLWPAGDWATVGTLGEPLTGGLIGGVVVLGSPTAAIAETISTLRSVALINPLFAVDEEGGRVQRLRALLGRLPSAEQQATDSTPVELQELVALHGEQVSDLGFDMILAPVLDVGNGPGIGDRALSADPRRVAEYGLAVLEGLQSIGLVAVVKHFPGHGRASADSHISLPTTPSYEELVEIDLQPFRAAIDGGASVVMVGHLEVPGLTGGAPASLSPEAVQGLLRDELGFDGLTMSDALDMGAITDNWTTSEAVVLALIAGVDVLLLGNDDELDIIHAQVAAAIVDGRLDDRRVTEAAARVLAVKGLNGCIVGTRLDGLG